MSTKQTLILSLAAGLTGGIFSRYLPPEMVHAQNQMLVPKEISAQSFALLEANGNRVGLTVSPTDRLAIALTPRHGPPLCNGAECRAQCESKVTHYRTLLLYVYTS